MVASKNFDFRSRWKQDLDKPKNHQLLLARERMQELINSNGNNDVIGLSKRFNALVNSGAPAARSRANKLKQLFFLTNGMDRGACA